MWLYIPVEEKYISGQDGMVIVSVSLILLWTSLLSSHQMKTCPSAVCPLEHSPNVLIVSSQSRSLLINELLARTAFWGPSHPIILCLSAVHTIALPDCLICQHVRALHAMHNYEMIYVWSKHPIELHPQRRRTGDETQRVVELLKICLRLCHSGTAVTDLQLITKRVFHSRSECITTVTLHDRMSYWPPVEQRLRRSCSNSSQGSRLKIKGFL